ncbi:hypothetical protein SAY86_023821 [Trapa natans]|uniref:Protein kinase domain-containing protein n=1 Tax=Trapa natans TaxID=22666 RepID=A0AAN7MB27_TRANT|nr:hypothetical protein SAY86_023821 [Trapa natans]
MKPLLFVFCVGICLLHLLHPTEPEVKSDRSALTAIRTAVRGRTLLWNLTAPTCSWVGVICDNNRRIVELHLPGMGLIGSVPTGVLGSLTTVQTLSLRYNALSGPIPPDIANLSSLRNLYLQGNNFSGEIPTALLSLQNLVRLNLASNKFSGSIPAGLNNLTRLKTLYLQNNQFVGPIPDLTAVRLEQFNVSFNINLTGSVPSSLSGNPASAFEATSLCGVPLKPCNGTSGSESSKNKLSVAAIAGIVAGVVAAAMGILLLIFVLFFKEKNDAGVGTQKSQAIVGSSGGVRSVPAGIEGKETKSAGKELVFFGKQTGMFGLEDLLRASAEVLGKGTFGTTYKAALEMGSLFVAVKRLKDAVVTEKEFREKMNEMGELQHENLVPLRAYYYNNDEKLLVYDYLPTGSLSALLHGNVSSGRTPLSWDSRCSIAVGVARAIAYIHSRGAVASHGNIKSSNILLTTSYEPRVSDFCLAHVARPASLPNRMGGYQAPEATDAHRVSQKSDVYSFGVLLLELLTGRAPVHSQVGEEEYDLPRWVQSVAREEWAAEVFDPELVRYQDVGEDMVQLLQLAVDCTSQHPDRRPSMAVVATSIEEVRLSSGQQYRNDVVDDATAGAGSSSPS